ncbi:E3 ubiquitin-protein ligase TRIM17-like [Pseudorasbora parva]|uniref:E3 ubiquitin-protein ligase TRIM17-like n=1 Tax=Pseudorasbora parva TaxID=51549 RepID=UPI00351E7FA4
MASRSFAEEDLSCPVCCDIFINPVLLSCSHSFCSTCIQRVWENTTLKECPVCRGTSLNDDPPLNLALRNLCESFLQENRQKSSPEAETVCSVHKEQFKLFCLDDQQPVCVVCRDSRKHTDHRFCPVDEAAADNKEILKASLEHLQERLGVSVDREQNLRKTAGDIKCQAQRTETQIQEEFNELHQLLHDEETFRLTALREEEEQKSLMMKEKTEETSKQISSLTSSIRDIEQQMKAEDVSFLQNFKATLQRAQFNLPDPDLSQTVTITFTDHLTNLKLSVLQKIQDNVAPDFSTDHVILDDSVKYNEHERLQSGGGNGTNIFGSCQSKEPPKENEIKTVSPDSLQNVNRVSPRTVNRVSRRTGNPDWRTGNPDSQQTGNPDSRRTGNRDSRRTLSPDWRTGNPDLRRTGNPDSQRTGNPDWRTGNPDSEQTVNPDSRRTGNPDWRTGNPDSEQTVNPDSRRTGNRNSRRTLSPDWRTVNRDLQRTVNPNSQQTVNRDWRSLRKAKHDN